MFEIGYYSLGNQIVVPVRDVNGELAGIRVRECDKDLIKFYGKYHPMTFMYKTYSFPSSEILYGLHITQEYIKAKKKCILFEGEKSVMKMESLYKNPPVAATFGNHIGMGQLKLLQDIGVEEVVVAFDHDGAMEDLSMIQSAEKVLKLSDMKYSFLYDGYEELLESHDSPIDKGKEVFEELLKRRALIRSESFDNVKGQDAVDEEIEKFLLENNGEKIKVLRGYSQFKENPGQDLLVYKVKESE